MHESVFEKVVIIGGRGNGTVVLSAIRDMSSQYVECVGFLNDDEKEIDGIPVLGPITKESWQSLDNNCRFIFAMSNIKEEYERYQMLKRLQIPHDRFINIIHPTAIVSRLATLGVGIALMPFSHVGPDVMVGNHSMMCAQSFIGHDSKVGEMVFVSNNATIGGRIEIGNGAHIGSNSSILERLKIGEFSIVGLGAVVIRNVPPFAKVVGNPAKIIGYEKAE